ncbi:ribosome biogenesis GTPase Der [Candidatus Dependentiae bacterium]
MSIIKVSPKVLLVGRTNVGKSTLFNRLSKNTTSIVLEQESVTRDYLQETINWNNKTFNLIDTGGISLKKTKDSILERVYKQVFELFEKATLIIFVCDGKNGLTLEDQKIAKSLHKSKKPLVLAINKSDNIKLFEDNLHDFYKLGIKTIIPISALHGKGISDLLEIITDIIPEPKTITETIKPAFKTVILGKPNVGKSSLMNILIKKDRSIVAKLAGTTREAISENIYFTQDIQNIIQLTDTPGIRKKSRVKEKIETLMVKSSLEAVRTSDIVLILIDASEQKISDQELKLLFYAYEQKKSIILIFNKVDLISQEQRKTFEYNLKLYDFIIKKIKTIWISCKTKKSIEKIFKEIQKTWILRNQQFDNAQIKELVLGYLEKKPMFHKTRLIKISKIYSVQAKAPTFTIKVNRPEWMKQSQLGFIENILRKHFDLRSCPIVFNIKKG